MKVLKNVHLIEAIYSSTNINLTRDGDSHVVGAQAHVGGVDVPGRGGDHSVVRSLQERSLRVDHLLRDGGVEDSLDRKVLDWQSLDLRDDGVVVRCYCS